MKMQSQLIRISAFLFICAGITDIEAQRSPSFEEVLSLQSVSNPTISPDGKHIVFEYRSVDWKENRYDTELWISKNGGEPIPLTNNPDNNSSRAKWSPDGNWIAFLSPRSDKTQIHALRVEGGESFQVSDVKNSAYGFEWSPDGTQIAFLQSEDKEEEEKSRKEKYGAFATEDEEYSMNQLWIIDFEPGNLNLMPLPEQLDDSAFKSLLEARLLLDSVEFTVNNFKWSPDGKKIAFTHQPDPLINTFFKSGISIYDIQSDSYELLVDNPSSDGLIDWSPDGKQILYTSSLDDTTSNYYLNGKIFIMNINGSGKRQLAKDFDEDLFRLRWNDKGIFAMAFRKTRLTLMRIDPGEGTAREIKTGSEIVSAYSFSDEGNHMAYAGSNGSDLNEVYRCVYPIDNILRVTNSSEQIRKWDVADSEVVSWKSKDGTLIEGILHKPQDYDPEKKYPLLVIIHGGPTGISLPEPAPSYVYPVIQWLNKGALVLRPNYRGSAGYGEEFRSLNVKNLGVGDAWDVLSGVDHLEREGIIDGNRVGAMGWSQGGYISAFLTTNSDKFKAISVGAGISNWMTYYVNTDIHPFTRQYLKATPWSDKAIYEKTSPMTKINNASIPTLIQHGEFDRRVPIANAYELFQGLQDVGVDTKLIVYKGFGHGITKPKERLAATWHNWQWFGQYIWDEDIEVPMD